ncbi:MAG: hypothetical protein KFW21_06760 [Spirochaetota bacterium]|nr:hypothetical protein [Spirochaetota bacterium]
MKKNIIISSVIGLTVGVILTLIGTLLMKQNSSGKATFSLALPTITKLDKDHLAKIENFGITLSDFTNAYDQVKKNLPAEQLNQISANESAARAEILETMINQYAVVATAIEEGFLEDQENMKLFRNAAQQALFQLYVAKNMPEDGNEFAVSQPEIDQAYAQYGAEFRARGLNAQQSKDYIISQIVQQKRQRWMIDFVSKIKEGFRIERNNSLLKEQNISAVQLSTVK